MQQGQLGLATFVSRLASAGVPLLILNVDSAVPLPADTAVECSGRVAGFIDSNNSIHFFLLITLPTNRESAFRSKITRVD
jgi:hypothetical protein